MIILIILIGRRSLLSMVIIIIFTGYLDLNYNNFQELVLLNLEFFYSVYFYIKGNHRLIFTSGDLNKRKFIIIFSERVPLRHLLDTNQSNHVKLLFGHFGEVFLFFSSFLFISFRPILYLCFCPFVFVPSLSFRLSH